MVAQTPVFVGVDVGKARPDDHLHPGGEAFAVAIDAARSATAPGVGPVLARTRLGRTPPGAVAALAGVAPYARQSAACDAPRRIAGGRPDPRAASPAALSAVRVNPRPKPLRERLRAAGKPAKVALVAAARELLLTPHAMLRRGRDRDRKQA